MLRQAPLLAHLFAQAATVFHGQIAPAWRRFLTTQLALVLPLVLPVFAHLLAHVAPLFGRQVAPMRLRPRAAHRAEKAQEQQRTGDESFHGSAADGVSDAIIVHPAGSGKGIEM